MIMPAKRVAIMQPYFLPYLGYWQLMNAVDTFVVYDNIQYTKKGWINRNRFLLNCAPETFTLPLQKDSEGLEVCQRFLALDFDSHRESIMRRLRAAYFRAPHFREVFPLLESIFLCPQKNLFDYIFNSIVRIKDILEVSCRIEVCSGLAVDHGLKGQDRVVSICRALNATEYINPIGGVELYSEDEFSLNGIELKFQRVGLSEYPQYSCTFVPALSIIDVLMFSGVNGAKSQLANMSLIQRGVS